MPTINPTGDAQFDVAILVPNELDRASVNALFVSKYREIRFGGLSAYAQWTKLFDPQVRDLSALPIGLLDQKALFLPQSCLPTDEAGLLQLCRRLIDAGEDPTHISVMLRSWPKEWTLEQHVQSLWQLREEDQALFEDIVRGRHGRALRRLAKSFKENVKKREAVQEMLGRQLLLWCAMDVQITTARARASFIAPMGSLVSRSMKVLKAGTVLRLMNCSLRALKWVVKKYELVGDSTELPKLKHEETKRSEILARRRVAAACCSLENDKKHLDETIRAIAGKIDHLEGMIRFCSQYDTTPIQRSGTAKEVKAPGNMLKHFHPVWYSGLSPAAGMSVALYRFAIAERSIPKMVRQAASGWRNQQRPAPFKSLPGLPKSKSELAELEDRVLDMCYSARRVHLRDEDRQSRSRPKFGSRTSEIDPATLERDPEDKAGKTFVAKARQFITVMGSRQFDAFHDRHSYDARHLTYWHLDVAPEMRLHI